LKEEEGECKIPILKENFRRFSCLRTILKYLELESASEFADKETVRPA
jgi:hypothetical protein